MTSAEPRHAYLAFLKYPDSVRRSFSTTNVAEAVNGQLEIMRRNSGLYFQSEDALRLKLGMAVTQLETGTWRRVAVSVDAALHQLDLIFESRFEAREESSDQRLKNLKKGPGQDAPGPSRVATARSGTAR